MTIKLYDTITSKNAVRLCLAVLALSTSFAFAGDHTTHKRYNKMGELVGEIGPKNTHSGGNNYLATRYSYNAQGLVTSIESGHITGTIPDIFDTPAQWSSFNPAVNTLKSYNSNGELISEVTQPVGGLPTSKTLFGYDDYGRLTCQNVVMDVSAGTTSCNDVGSYGNYNRIAWFEYNDYDQPTKEYRAIYTPLSQVYKTYAYDSKNRLKSVMDANYNKTEYSYDTWNRLSYVYYPDKDFTYNADFYNYEKYTYDNNGNRLSLRKRAGDVIHYEYDNLNRLIKKDLPSTTKDIFYDYDLRGLQLYTVYYSDSSTSQGVVRAYDGFGRVTSESNKFLWNAPMVNQYEYDEHGNRTKLTYPDGVVIEYGYDEMDRIVSMDLPGVSTDMTYAYNEQGLPDSMQRPNNTSTSISYDNAMRVATINENLNGTASDNTYTYAYNPANQIKNLTVSNQTYNTDHTAQGTPGLYITNGLNQYVEANGRVFDYDNNGNLILDEAKDAVYEYSDENQLTKAIVNNTTTDLSYDAAGRLLSVGDKYFLYDGAAVIAEYQQGGYPSAPVMQKRYVHSVGIDNPIAEYNGSSTSQYSMTYYHKNHQGSIVAASNYSGGVTYNNGYDSFGVPEPTNQGRFGYTGQMYLHEIGLYHYKARTYNPYIGRFMQTDPIGYEDGMNWYNYVGNDPMTYIDMSGLAKLEAGLSVELVIGAGIGLKVSLSFDTDNLELGLNATAGPRVGISAAAGLTGSISESGNSEARNSGILSEFTVDAEAGLGMVSIGTDLVSESPDGTISTGGSSVGGSSDLVKIKPQLKFGASAGVNVGIKTTSSIIPDAIDSIKSAATELMNTTPQQVSGVPGIRCQQGSNNCN